MQTALDEQCVTVNERAHVIRQAMAKRMALVSLSVFLGTLFVWVLCNFPVLATLRKLAVTVVELEDFLSKRHVPALALLSVTVLTVVDLLRRIAQLSAMREFDSTSQAGAWKAANLARSGWLKATGILLYALVGVAAVMLVLKALMFTPVLDVSATIVHCAAWSASVILLYTDIGAKLLLPFKPPPPLAVLACTDMLVFSVNNPSLPDVMRQYACECIKKTDKDTQKLVFAGFK